jgi:uncharacterized membrane protein
MKTAIISMSVLAVLVAVGSYHQAVAVPYMVIGAICTVVVLVALGKIKPREYPVYIYGMTLALLWQTSMLGGYPVGSDIQGEYFIATRAVTQGWDWAYPHPFNTSVVLGGLAPVLDGAGMPVLWQFKALYPAMFASVPLILYFAYRKMMGERRAFWASLFFMFVPVFFVEIVGIVKSMVAEIFLALMVLFLALDVKIWQKALGMGLSVVAASLCHYTIGILAVMYLAGGLLVLLAGKAIRRGVCGRLRPSLAVPFGSVVIVAVTVNFLWFASAGGGCMVGAYQEIGKNMATSIAGYFDFHKADAVASGDIVVNPSPGGEVYAEESVLGTDVPDSPSTRAVPPGEAESASEPFYLYGQEPVVKTAIGLDFGDASAGGKVFRVMQYLTEFLLFLGFIYLLFRHGRYKFRAEFVACIPVSFVLLGLCVFWLGFSSWINATRFYQISLFFLAPMLVVGVEELGDDVIRGARWLKRSR